MANISLAMIVKDEAKVLARCLDSVKDVVDEIVIVDTGSTDGTLDIAKRYTDKVLYFDWIDDFSAARNFSFDQCTKDFILWLDADDEVQPEDAQKIKELDLSDKEIVICDYVYSHDEFGNDQCIVPRERILRRNLNPRWQEEIHEYILVNHQTFISGIRVHHWKKAGSSERNLRILERIVKGDDPTPGAMKPGVKPRNVFYLGKEYQDFGKIDEAIIYLSKYVQMSGMFWEDVFRAWFFLAQCYMHKHDDNNFKRCFFESMKMEERRAELYCLMGEYYMNMRRWDRAVYWYKMAAVIERPKELLSAYQPEYYTWVPHLQLCVCYNALGDIKKAYEHNKKVLEYRPKDSRAVNNDRLLSSALEKKTLRDGEGKRLNLGCGGKSLSGYVNVDLFPGRGVDEVFGLDEIPYKDGTIGGISSEHALEHVGWIRSDKALREWFRVLQPGGELLLKMPDFEDCCWHYLDTKESDTVKRQWYKYTIYGIQQSQAGEPDDAQTHRSGYSRRELVNKLTEIGFVVDYSENYDGWDTPSVAVRALKPLSGPKVGWVSSQSPEAWGAAQTRLRVLNVNRWLRSKGYRSDVVTYNQIINQNYDIAIVGKTYNEDHFKNIKMLKQHGKTVYCDICEDLIGWPWVNEILSVCDKVICCSRKLEEKVKAINSNTDVIEEAWET